MLARPLHEELTRPKQSSKQPRCLSGDDWLTALPAPLQKQMQQMVDMYLGAGILMTPAKPLSRKWPSKARSNGEDLSPDADPLASRRV